jgi:arylsulfatase A
MSGLAFGRGSALLSVVMLQRLIVSTVVVAACVVVAAERGDNLSRQGTERGGDLSRRSAEREGRSHNILLIHTDDLGYGDLSVYGQRRFETPNIDRLAKEGIRFTQYYAGSTVCAPSRYSLMTGLHTGHAWVRGNGEIPLRPEDVTIAEVLRERGYRTAIIGKWGLGRPGTPGLPPLQGFDESFGYLDHRHAHRQYTDYLYRNGKRIDVDPSQYANDLVTEEAQSFISRSAERDQPFFLYLNYSMPHAELLVPKDSMAPFVGRFPETPFENKKADANPSPKPGPSGGYRSQPTPYAAFAGMVTRIDRYVGELVSLLEREGLDDSTLVLFTSDNGPHKEGGANPEFFQSGGPLRGIKRDLYEGGIRVPMIARWPGTVPVGQVSDHPWSHWDMMPTLAELAGADAPDGIDGMSMVRALRGEAQPTHDFFYWEFHERGFDQAVRHGNWKAVRHGLDQPLELYDLASDVGEQQDVAAQHPEVVEKIEEYLRGARTESERWAVTESADAARP